MIRQTTSISTHPRLATILAVAIGLAMFTPAANAQQSESSSRTPSGTRPANVVLVHGAWADASCWTEVVKILQKSGVNVTAVQLPLTSLDDDIAVTRQALAEQQGPTVLVGHSYGGAVITGAANQAPGVVGLVYIAAFGLDEGESLEDLSKRGPTPAGAAQIHADNRGFLWIDRDGFPQAFAADVDSAEARVMAVSQKPLSVKSFAAKSGPPAWKHIRSWYLVSANDQMIPPTAEEFMGKRMGASVRTITASHASIVSHPREVAEVIGLAVQAAAPVVQSASAK